MSVHGEQGDKLQAARVEQNLETGLQYSESGRADSEAIRNKTGNCMRLFEICQESAALGNTGKLDGLCAKFNWWSLGIGASKQGCSSLDYRVRNREDIRERFVTLLDGLKISLWHCIGIAQTLMVDVKHTQSSFKGDDGDDSDLGETLHYISSNIEYLSRLSALVRKSGAKFRHKRADNLMSQREADLESFGNFLRNLISIVPTQLGLRDVLQAHLVNPPPLDPVQRRLIQANLVRRNRFEVYYEMYRRKDGSPPRTTREADQTSITQTQYNQSTAPIRPVEPPHKVRKLNKIAKSDGYAPSSQEATDIGSVILPPRSSGLQPKSTGSQVSRGVLKQDYPKCPVTDKDFWCPYCAQALDTSYSNPKRSIKWRGHVSEDLSPYTCVYADCDQADAMYVTTEEWRKHIKSCHSIPRWICDVCWLKASNPGNFEFDEEEGWFEHSKACHFGEYAIEDLRDIAEESRRAVVPPVACPLCHDNTLLSPDTDKHIADHLHSFALLALPWESIGPDDDTQASLGSNTGKALPDEDDDDISEEIFPATALDTTSLLDQIRLRCQRLRQSQGFEMLRDTWDGMLQTLLDLRRELPSSSVTRFREATELLLRLSTTLSRSDDIDLSSADNQDLVNLSVDLHVLDASIQALVPLLASPAYFDHDLSKFFHLPPDRTEPLSTDLRDYDDSDQPTAEKGHVGASFRIHSEHNQASRRVINSLYPLITTTVITFAGVAIQSAKAAYNIIDSVQEAPPTIAHSKTLLSGTGNALGTLTEILTDNTYLHNLFGPVLQRLKLKATLTATDELCKKFGDTLTKYTSRSTEASFSKRDRILESIYKSQIVPFNKNLIECQTTISLLTGTITVIFDKGILNHSQTMGTQVDNLERDLSKLIADLANEATTMSAGLQAPEGETMFNLVHNEQSDTYLTTILLESNRAARDALTEKKQTL